MTDIVPVSDRDTYALVPLASDLADRLCKTEFVPAGLRNKPEATMAAMLTGHEIGLPPMASLAEIAVIQGTPCMSAKSMRMLVLSKGHDIWFEEKNNTKVTICGQRLGKDRVSKVTWTLDDAQRAGLAAKQGWKQYPRAYLTARATAELCRDIFADVLGGISYTPEEAEDFDTQPPDDEGDDIGGDTEAPKGSTRKATRSVTKKTAAKKAGARRQPPEAPASTAAAAPPPPLPGEDGYDDVLDIPAAAVRERPADETDDVDDDQADDGENIPASGEIDLPATLEQAGVTNAKFLREARRVAKARGENQPTAVEEITDGGLIAAVLDDLGLAPVLSSTPVGVDSPVATEGRNKKMWAAVADAWPDDNDEDRDELRRTVIKVVSGGRTESSKTLNVGEWDDLFAALDAIRDGDQELHLRASGDWELRHVRDGRRG